jgi:leukotriene-A4 hydrolase
LNFVSPDMLTGDKSEIFALAHELAHSWAGNLVNNATWNDAWVNEGLTTYLDKRILEDTYGRDMAEAISYEQQGWLKSILARTKDPRDTDLRGHLDGRDPNEGLGWLIYIKGNLFFRKIEETVGRAKFDQFLNKYFGEHKFQSISTDQFMTYLRKELIKGDPRVEQEIQLDKWVDGPGLPDGAPTVTSKIATQVNAQLKEFNNGTPATTLKIEGWGPFHRRAFLRGLPPEMAPARLAELDRVFHFSDSDDVTVKATWIVTGIRSNYEPAIRSAQAFLLEHPSGTTAKVFTALVDSVRGKDLAKRIFRELKDDLHPVVREEIEEILKSKDETK